MVHFRPCPYRNEYPDGGHSLRKEISDGCTSEGGCD
jgi:hypothetical protein